VLRTLAAFVAATAALTITSASSAAAYVPATETQFNVPAAAPGSTALKQRVFLDAVIGALDATPAGETVTISMFSLYDPAATDAILRAHQRKVNVRYLTWDQNPKGVQLNQVKDELGTDTRAKSWFKMCHGSCAFSGDRGAHHAKLVLSSRIIDSNGRSVRSLTLVSSGNLTDSGAAIQWNEFQTITDPKIYAAAQSYILSIKGDQTRYDFPSASSASGKYRLAFFPRKNLPVDPVLDTLRDVSCDGGGKIRVAMFFWSSKRAAMARQIVALRRAGCDVAVLFDSWQTDDSVEALLSRGHVPIYDTHVGDAKGMFMHAKTTILSARVKGKRRNYVFAGSPNFSWAARQLNSESMLRINSLAEVNLHFRWWDSVLAATTTARA
jgi:hypothetical protein